MRARRLAKSTCWSNGVLLSASHARKLFTATDDGDKYKPPSRRLEFGLRLKGPEKTVVSHKADRADSK